MLAMGTLGNPSLERALEWVAISAKDSKKEVASWGVKLGFSDVENSPRRICGLGWKSSAWIRF